ncbi:6679_t:CDS:1, partial [Scutellospora calospora]
AIYTFENNDNVNINTNEDEEITTSSSDFLFANQVESADTNL